LRGDTTGYLLNSREEITMKKMPTPEEFKELTKDRDPIALAAAVDAYTTQYEMVLRGYNETRDSVVRFKNDGGRGGYV